MSPMENLPTAFNKAKIDASPDLNILAIKFYAEKHNISFEDAVPVYRKQILENVDSERNLKGLEQALELIK